MTQYHRALAGKLFDVHSPEMIEKHGSHILCQQYNQAAEDNPIRRRLIRRIAGEMGEGPSFQGSIQFHYDCNIHVGKGCYLNSYLTVLDDSSVIIGDGTATGAGVVLTEDIWLMVVPGADPAHYPSGLVPESFVKTIPEDRSHLNL